MDALLHPAKFAGPLAGATTGLSLLGIFCSAMIYVDTRREFWSAPLVFSKFFGTALLLGAAGCAATLAWMNATEAACMFAVAATVIRTALFGWEAMNLRDGLAAPNAPNHRSALVIWKLCRPLVVARGVLFFGSTLFGVLAVTHTGMFAAVCATISLLLTAASQVIERYFFFTAVIAPRMPGGIAA
jgi:DMSO reductase anchor subunit